MSGDDCVICAELRGEGPYVWQDALVRVSHLQPDEGPVVLGHVIVETRRHAAHLDGLTDAEAAAVGTAARDAARALRAELDVEYVHAAVVNARIEHFHQHVYVRHRGTPEEYRWHDADEWPDAPHGDAETVAAFSDRLRPYFTR